MRIVTGGCSFTETEDCLDYERFNLMERREEFQVNTDYKSWALHLEDVIDGSIVHNEAMPGAGNGYISRAIIHRVSKLIDDGRKPDWVIVQWSGVQRKEMLLDFNEVHEDDKNRASHFIDRFLPIRVRGRTMASRLNRNKLWYKHAYDNDTILKHWYKYYGNEDFCLLETLEHMLRLQWYLENQNIKFKFFFGWELFRHYERLPRLPLEINHIWKLLDWDKFWFHNNEYVQSNMGGITEWSMDRFDTDLERFVTDLRTKEGALMDLHPSQLAHKTFAKEVVSEWINNS
tara:strand:+ start:2427 stop:3290 length:864 start_codon:yes stop_codon:yes gene_type:complete